MMGTHITILGQAPKLMVLADRRLVTLPRILWEDEQDEATYNRLLRDWNRQN